VLAYRLQHIGKLTRSVGVPNRSDFGESGRVGERSFTVPDVIFFEVLTTTGASEVRRSCACFGRSMSQLLILLVYVGKKRPIESRVSYLQFLKRRQSLCFQRFRLASIAGVRCRWRRSSHESRSFRGSEVFTLSQSFFVEIQSSQSALRYCDRPI